MKRIVISILLLLCFLVCSCEKNVQRDLLLGSWEITQSVTYTEAKSGRPRSFTYSTPFYYTFEKSGYGKYFREGSSAVEFTFKYNDKDNTIEYLTNGIQGLWFIDLLTEENIIFHGERDEEIQELDVVENPILQHLSCTYKGKRLK